MEAARILGTASAVPEAEARKALRVGILRLRLVPPGKQTPEKSDQGDNHGANCVGPFHPLGRGDPDP